MELKNFFAQDDAGNILNAATCYLYVRGTESLVEVLQGANGLALDNPFLSDQQGLVQFAAPNGLYDLRVVKGSRDYRLRMQCNDVTETLDAAEQAVRELEERLKDKTDPKKGARLVAWQRSHLPGGGGTVDDALSVMSITPLEFLHLVVERPDPENPKTWNWTSAIQAAINRAIAWGGALELPYAMVYRTTEPLSVGYVGTPSGIEGNRWATRGINIYGKGSSILYEGTSGFALNVLPYAHHTNIDALGIFAPNGTAGGIDSFDAMHGHITRCPINVASTGIRKGGMAVGSISQCVIKAKDCVTLEGGDVVVELNDFFPQSGGYGVKTRRFGDHKINNNVFSLPNSGNAVAIGGTGEFLIPQAGIDGNQFYLGTASTNIAIYYPAVAGTSSLISSTITKNTFWPEPSYAGDMVVIARMQSVSIIENYLDFRVGNYAASFILVDFSAASQVADNIMLGSSGRLFKATTGSSALRVSDNIYRPLTSVPSSDCIDLGLSTYSTVSDNTLMHTGAAVALHAVTMAPTSSDTQVFDNSCKGFTGGDRGINVPQNQSGNVKRICFSADYESTPSATWGNGKILQTISSAHYNRFHVKAWVHAVAGSPAATAGYYEAMGVFEGGVMFVTVLHDVGATPGSNQGLELVVSDSTWILRHKSGMTSAQSSTANTRAWLN